MADLSVDLDGLSNVAGALRGVADGLDNTRALVNAVEDSVGSKDVAGALDDFENYWDDGRGRIKDNMANLEKMLDESVKQYRQVDQDLADALKEKPTETKQVAS